MPDIRELTATLLLEREASRRQKLDSLLAEAELLENWSGIAPSPELRALLKDRKSEISFSLLELLLEWRKLGGTIGLREERGREAAEPRREEVREFRMEEPREIRREEGRREEPRREENLHLQEEAATGESVSRLAEHFRAGPQFREVQPVDWRPELEVSLENVEMLVTDDEQELERIYKGIREAERWRVMPKDIQRCLIGFMASRLRRLQDERGVNSPKIEESFSRLSAFSKREQPGYVIGLSRHHHPLRENWEADAESYWERMQAWLPEPTSPPPLLPNHEKFLTELEGVAKELQTETPPEIREAVESQFKRMVRESLKLGLSSRDPRLIRICTPYEGLLEGVEYRVLRRTIREQQADDAVELEEESTPARNLLPEDWRWWGRTRGRRALMVGGDPREPNRLRLQEAFQFSSLEWEPAEFRRNSLIAVRDRVRAGKVDLAIILGSFVGHDADEIILPACRERGVDWVHVDKGYGVVRLQRAIERFLDPAPPEGAE